MSVIIAGGGMAGATLALAIAHLSRGTLPVTVVEAREPGAGAHPGYDSRAIALAEGTCRQLMTIGLWPHLADSATPITRIHVSDRGHAGSVVMQAADYGLPALGQVAELHDIGSRLVNLLRQTPGITLRCPALVTATERNRQTVRVVLDSGESLTGKLLVAADGSHSPLAAACGIQWQREEYQQVAIIANVSTQLPHQGQAFERFTASGPLALLPMSQGRCSLVWCHTRQQQPVVESWDEAQFLQALQHTFGWRLGRFTHAGQRSSYPLALQIAGQHTAHRLALVGNAAQTLHPIAGQGFNLGMRDVMTLAETLVQAYYEQQDIGGFSVLERYRQRRKPDQHATITITDGLVRLFSRQYLPFMVGRNLGMAAMDKFALLRSSLTERTLGWVRR